jgi:hypothetical protein
MFVGRDTFLGMAKTRKVQVTLEETEYATLVSLARMQGKKVAAVVRESIRKYSLSPDVRRVKRKALQDLLSLPPTPVPGSHQKWKHQYGELKIRTKSNKR